MINGNYSEFLDALYYGDELYLKYKEHIYFIQGWLDINNSNNHKCTIQCVLVDTSPLKLLYEKSSKSMYECAQQFLLQPIFEGKTLAEIERYSKWVDTELG